jgi:gamma-glutamyltranspeptidase / glutathione hydrolase
MRGAIAAGHPLTAEAGARVLAEGGNAVDACIAAAFASWVAESPLTGPGGGGFILVHRGHDRGARLLDFFVDVPGRGLAAHERRAMDDIDVSFGDSTQVFHIGAPSCTVPGAPAGLEEAHRAFGTLPWRELLAPAIELARSGVELTRPQAYLHAILDLILRHTDEGRTLYSRDGERLVAGDRLVMGDLADTLELLAERGAKEFYSGELAHALVEHVRAGGGEITEDDLAAYRVIWRRPVRVSFRDHVFLSNPPPSSGGVLIGYALRLLDELGIDPPAGSAEAIAELVEVMREGTRVRTDAFAAELYRGGLVKRLLSDESVAEGLERLRGELEGRPEVAGAPGTTHIAVVDASGNAASCTASTGSGSGVIVPGTGVHVNNMLGEYDLVATRVKPGMRLTSMMAPSLVLRGELPRLVVGSAGSVRLRGAILQIVLNVIRHELDVEGAIERPRVHFEDTHVHCEGGTDPAEIDRLEAMGYDITRWRRKNLYFGGAAAVEVREDGSLAAAGDSRRGGAGVVVESTS